MNLHRSGITLVPLTGEVNNTDYLFIMAPGIYQARNEHFVLKVDVLEAGKWAA